MSLPNIADMPDAREVSDRDLLLHIAGQLDKLHAELESYRPLLDMIKGRDGRPDMIGLMQARREAKKAGRRG